MAAIPFATAEAEQTYGVLRGPTIITPAAADDVQEIILPPWTRIFTVETLAGDIKVHTRGVDGDPIGAFFTDVKSGAGPRAYSISDGRNRAGNPATGTGPSIFVASNPGAILFVVEAQANEKNP